MYFLKYCRDNIISYEGKAGGVQRLNLQQSGPMKQELVIKKEEAETGGGYLVGGAWRQVHVQVAPMF